jgi:hypothetical protein
VCPTFNCSPRKSLVRSQTHSKLPKRDQNLEISSQKIQKLKVFYIQMQAMLLSMILEVVLEYSCINNCPIVWESKRQSVIALSSAEAEYVALVLCLRYVKWMQNLLIDLICPLEKFIANLDNQSAVRVAMSATVARSLDTSILNISLSLRKY